MKQANLASSESVSPLLTEKYREGIGPSPGSSDLIPEEFDDAYFHT